MAFPQFSIQLHAKEASTKVEPISAEQISFDNRIRQFGTPDQIFNYFSSIQLVNKFGTIRNIFTKMSKLFLCRSEDSDDVPDGLLQLHNPRLLHPPRGGLWHLRGDHGGATG